MRSGSGRGVRTGWARIDWSKLGPEGEARLAEHGVTVRCLQTADGGIPESDDEPGAVAILGRAYQRANVGPRASATGQAHSVHDSHRSEVVGPVIGGDAHHQPATCEAEDAWRAPTVGRDQLGGEIDAEPAPGRSLGTQSLVPPVVAGRVVEPPPVTPLGQAGMHRPDSDLAITHRAVQHPPGGDPMPESWAQHGETHDRRGEVADDRDVRQIDRGGVAVLVGERDTRRERSGSVERQQTRVPATAVLVPGGRVTPVAGIDADQEVVRIRLVVRDVASRDLHRRIGAENAPVGCNA